MNLFEMKFTIQAMLIWIYLKERLFINKFCFLFGFILAFSFSLFYRFSLKSTAIFWSPLLWVILQKACCVIEDGILGPVTAGVANSMDKATLLRALDRERALYYARIVRSDRTQGDFIVGWVKRMFELAA